MMLIGYRTTDIIQLAQFYMQHVCVCVCVCMYVYFMQSNYVYGFI